LVFICNIAQKNDKIDKDKFITSVYALLKRSGYTLRTLQFLSDVAPTISTTQQQTITRRHTFDSTLRCASPYEIAVLTY